MATLPYAMGPPLLPLLPGGSMSVTELPPEEEAPEASPGPSESTTGGMPRPEMGGSGVAAAGSRMASASTTASAPLACWASCGWRRVCQGECV